MGQTCAPVMEPCEQKRKPAKVRDLFAIPKIVGSRGWKATGEIGKAPIGGAGNRKETRPASFLSQRSTEDFWEVTESREGFGRLKRNGTVESGEEIRRAIFGFRPGWAISGEGRLEKTIHIRCRRRGASLQKKITSSSPVVVSAMAPATHPKKNAADEKSEIRSCGGDNITPFVQRPGKEHMREGHGVETMSSAVRREREEAVAVEKGGRPTPLLVPEEALGKLSLLDEDDNALVVDFKEAAKNFCKWLIVVVYLTSRVYSPNALFTTMRRVWKPHGDMTEKPMPGNRFIIELQHEGDYLHILRGGPWIHDNDTLLVAAHDGMRAAAEVPVDILPMWARIYELPPFIMMDDTLCEQAGKKLGKVRLVHTNNNGRTLDQFLRIRIEHKVVEPLRRWIKIEGTDGRDAKRCPVKYEHVPHFCFYCGIIGHTEKSCLIIEEEKIGRFSTEQPASPYKMFEHRSFYMPGEVSSAKRNLQFGRLPSQALVMDAEDGNGKKAGETEKLGTNMKATDNDERTTTDPMIKAVVKGVVAAVENLKANEEVVADRVHRITNIPMQVNPEQQVKSKTVWNQRARSEHSRASSNGRGKPLFQAAKRNPGLGRLAAAIRARVAKHTAGLATGREANKPSDAPVHPRGVDGLVVTTPAHEVMGVAAIQQLALHPYAGGATDGPVQPAVAYSPIREYGRSDSSICRELYGPDDTNNAACVYRRKNQVLGKRSGEDRAPMDLDDENNLPKFSFESSKKSRGSPSVSLEEETRKEDAKKSEATSHGAAGQLTGTDERACQEP
ncbi:hypothetical protein VPH35_135392 [Triticum aestivum]